MNRREGREGVRTQRVDFEKIAERSEAERRRAAARLLPLPLLALAAPLAAAGLGAAGIAGAGAAGAAAGAAGLVAGAGATLGSAFVESLLTIDTGRPQRKIRYQFVYPDGSVAPAPPGFRGARGERQHCFG